MSPETATFEKLTVIVLVLVPAVMVTPVGKLHTYPVAFVIAGTLYIIPDCPRHMGEGPVIVPAAAGCGLTVIVNVVMIAHWPAVGVKV